MVISRNPLKYFLWKNICSLKYRRLNIECLNNRGFISLKGKTVSSFLQGLITNDIRSINQGNTFLYSLILNTRGRVISDSFIYPLCNDVCDDPHYIIEVDSSCLEKVEKHLSFYNLRKKISISVDGSLSLWIVMPSNQEGSLLNSSDTEAWLQMIDSTKTIDQINHDPNQLVFCALDPRASIGWSGRIVMKNQKIDSIQDIFSDYRPNTRLDISNYNRTRWMLGLPEGSKEIIPDETLPLDANTDLSGGVNFSKGCYIGQELTARSHFTGVIRRRFVPIKLKIHKSATNLNLKSVSISQLYNTRIYCVSDGTDVSVKNLSKVIGWIRGIDRFTLDDNSISLEGIALMRLTESAQENASLIVPYTLPETNDMVLFNVTPFVPYWWPDTIGLGIERLQCF